MGKTTEKLRVILASNSPRRKELLAKLVPSFEIIPSTSPEITREKEPARYATDLAKQKALNVFATNGDALVIGCDTVVECDGKILGKPRTAEEAKQMLWQLSDRTHFVHTGACIVWGRELREFCDTTAVTFRRLSQQEVDSYVASGAPMDKAGAYGIQECGFVLYYDGSYDNVVGFPTEKVSEILKEIYKG